MKYLLLLTTGVLLSAMAYTQGCIVNYVDPTFQLKKTDPNCLPNTGIIEAFNLQNGVGPFTYKLVETNTTNATGLFTGLAPGLYTVELRDACGTVRARQATLVPWSFSFQFNISKTSDCNDGQVAITTTPQTGVFEYGIVKNNDTTWTNSPVFDIKLYKRLTILVKDACGNMQAQVWNAPDGFVPYIQALQYRLQCDKFDLFPVYYGFNDPEVCLYENGTNKLIECKSASGSYTGGFLTNFYDIPWGEYYVIVTDKCYRDSAFHPDMRSAGGSELNPYNWDCTTFTMHVDGMEDTVCLYDGLTNKLISCKGQDTVSINPRTGLPWPSGAVWDSLPYGSYYAWIYDPCEDSTFRIDTVVNYPFTVYMNAYPGCSLNQTTVQVEYSPQAKKPFIINFYNANGTLNTIYTTNNPTSYIGITPDSSGGNLTIVAYDGCGKADTAELIAPTTNLTKTVNVYNKCPGLNGNGGSGDINIFIAITTYAFPVPQIVKKDGVDTTISYSFHINNDFGFPNLPAGVYIIKYTFTNCSQLVLYDTVTVNDYEYPGQAPDTAIQCGGNMFTFAVPVTGGLSPYTFQIIENTPALPSLLSTVQSSSTFVVGNGQHYSSVKVRTIDRCGNSTIGDIAIQPLNGCSTLDIDTLHANTVIQNRLARVYPNPSNKQFTISINQRKKANYRIEIVNTTGTLLYKKLFFDVDSKNITINEHFIPGLYIIKITDMATGNSSLFKQVIN